MADSKGKYQPWGHEEFMADVRVRRMTPTALKTYMMLLHEAFVCEVRPNLPDDEEELELMAYCTDHEEWLSVRDTVLGMFTRELIDGVQVLTRKRLQDDWNKIQEIREARSEAGKEGAKARWNGKNSKPMANDGNPIAKNSKEVSKEVKKEREEKEERNSDSLSDFENPDNGQGEGMNLKAFKQEMTNIGIKRSMKITGYPDTWENLKLLSNAHGSQAVLNDFDSFLSEGDDYPKGALSAYNQVASDRLSSNTPSLASAKDPEVVSLVRELSYASGGLVCFLDKQRARLAEVLKEFTAEEIKSAFKTWVETQDLNDTKNLSYAPGKFVQIADNLAYSARKQKQEAEKAKTLRDATARRLQEEAEIDRQAREKMKQDESEIFDPLAELLSETDKAVV